MFSWMHNDMIAFLWAYSVSGHKVAPPDGHFYSGCKHALTALTEGLRLELRQQNSHIRVSVSSLFLKKGQISTCYLKGSEAYDLDTASKILHG